ncbi:MAG: hypothetical protein ACYTBZ_18690, partial [Planctomycetota bacterium]
VDVRGRHLVGERTIRIARERHQYRLGQTIGGHHRRAAGRTTGGLQPGKSERRRTAGGNGRG